MGPDGLDWTDMNLVWIFREAATLYEAAGEITVAKRLERYPANEAAAQGGASASDRAEPGHHEQLRAEFAKGPHAFLLALADVLDRHDPELAYDLRNLTKRLNWRALT